MAFVTTDVLQVVECSDDEPLIAEETFTYTPHVSIKDQWLYVDVVGMTFAPFKSGSFVDITFYEVGSPTVHIQTFDLFSPADFTVDPVEFSISEVKYSGLINTATGQQAAPPLAVNTEVNFNVTFDNPVYEYDYRKSNQYVVQLKMHLDDGTNIVCYNIVYDTSRLCIPDCGDNYCTRGVCSECSEYCIDNTKCNAEKNRCECYGAVCPFEYQCNDDTKLCECKGDTNCSDVFPGYQCWSAVTGCACQGKYCNEKSASQCGVYNGMYQCMCGDALACTNNNSCIDSVCKCYGQPACTDGYKCDDQVAACSCGGVLDCTETLPGYTCTDDKCSCNGINCSLTSADGCVNGKCMCGSNDSCSNDNACINGVCGCYGNPECTAGTRCDPYTRSCLDNDVTSRAIYLPDKQYKWGSPAYNTCECYNWWDDPDQNYATKGLVVGEIPNKMVFDLLKTDLNC